MSNQPWGSGTPWDGNQPSWSDSTGQVGSTLNSGAQLGYSDVELRQRAREIGWDGVQRELHSGIGPSRSRTSYSSSPYDDHSRSYSSSSYDRWGGRPSPETEFIHDVCSVVKFLFKAFFWICRMLMPLGIHYAVRFIFTRPQRHRRPTDRRPTVINITGVNGKKPARHPGQDLMDF